MEPRAVLFKCGEKLLYPASGSGCAPTILVGVGPTAELFPVIAHCQDTPAVRGCEGAQGFYSLVYGSPGNGIAHDFAGSEDLQDGALILGGVVAIEVAILQPYIFEMYIIQDGPLDARLADQARQSWFPDPLGDPHATCLHSEAVGDAIRQAANLGNFVAVRDGREVWLVVAVAHDLNLIALFQFRDALQEFRMCFF